MPKQHKSKMIIPPFRRTPSWFWHLYCQPFWCLNTMEYPFESIWLLQPLPSLPLLMPRFELQAVPHLGKKVVFPQPALKGIGTVYLYVPYTFCFHLHLSWLYCLLKWANCIEIDFPIIFGRWSLSHLISHQTSSWLFGWFPCGLVQDGAQPPYGNSLFPQNDD